MYISKSKCLKHTRSGIFLKIKMSKKCTSLWHEIYLQVKIRKIYKVRSTFGSWDLEKMHTIVVRSTFPSQNIQNTRFGALLEVEMWKKCTPLWPKPISKLKYTKQIRSTTSTTSTTSTPSTTSTTSSTSTTYYFYYFYYFNYFYCFYCYYYSSSCCYCYCYCYDYCN